MANSQGYTTLRSIIGKMLYKKGQTSNHSYMALKVYGIECLQKIYRDHAQEVKTKRLTMSALKTVELPMDFVSLVKIGVQVGDKVRVFLKDPKIALLYSENDCGEEQANVSASGSEHENSEYRYPFYFGNYVNDQGEHQGGFYGYSNGSIEEGYVINGKTIHFNSNVDTADVYIEYVSTGFNPSEETIIPTVFDTAIQAYIKWQEASDKLGPNSSDARGWQMNYGKEINMARASQSPLRVEDILYASRSGYNLSTKS